MYEDFFGFKYRPFASVPELDHYFPAAAIEAARQTLLRCIDRGEGAGLVIGPSGTGKTLLCRLLAQHFHESAAVATLCSGRLSSRRALFQAVLYELGRPYRGMDEGELRLALVDYLTVANEGPAMLVLLVDEAHTLPLRLLDEIRMLCNLVRDGKPLVRLVLAGAPMLEERLANPKLESFSQRLAARCYLVPFERAETEQYVAARIAAARAPSATDPNNEVFSSDARRAIHQATDGVPRLINQVCDHAMLLAYAGGKREIDAAGIEEAWADLQQLPTPSSDESEGAEARSIIEFGGLDDETDATPSEARTKDVGRREHEAGPALRVAAWEAESPDRQIDDIEETLAELEEGFEPAGSIRPEVELTCKSSGDPFGERFEEEEVVADRYAAVATATRRVEAAACEPAADECLDNCETSQQTEDLFADPYCPTEREASLDVAVASAHDGDDAETSAASACMGEDSEGTYEVTFEPDAEPETVPLRSEPASQGITMMASGGPESAESELIVVEDDYDDEPPRDAPSSTKADRKEYRRLFAKLRSG